MDLEVEGVRYIEMHRGPGQIFFGRTFDLVIFSQRTLRKLYACAGTPTLFRHTPGNGGMAPENGAKHDYPTFEPAIRVFYTRVYILVCGKASSLPTVISQCGEVDKA